MVSARHDAVRLRDRAMHRFRFKDVPGLIIVGALLAFSTYTAVTRPNRPPPSGFGAEWQCGPNGRSGPDYCIKKSQLAPRAVQ